MRTILVHSLPTHVPSKTQLFSTLKGDKFGHIGHGRGKRKLAGKTADPEKIFSQGREDQSREQAAKLFHSNSTTHARGGSTQTQTGREKADPPQKFGEGHEAESGDQAAKLFHSNGTYAGGKKLTLRKYFLKVERKHADASWPEKS